MKNRAAFNLVELSIVITVFSLLLIAIGSGTKLIRQAKVKSAERITDTSPVWEIVNDELERSVVAWFDALDRDSMDLLSGTTTNEITNWRSKVNVGKYFTATQSTTDEYPKYSRDGMDNFPAVLFDGTDDSFTVPTPLRTGDTTVSFAVAFYSTSTDAGVIFNQGASTTAAATSYSLAPDLETSFLVNDAGADAANLSTNRIHAVVLTVDGDDVSAYVNNEAVDTGTLGTSVVLANDVATIGSDSAASPVYFNGYLGELIIFDKVLTSSEVTLMTEYLTTKYRIK